MCFTYTCFWVLGLGHPQVPLPESTTETLTQHPAEIEGSVKTTRFGCVGARVKSGLLMLFGGGGRGRGRRKELSEEFWQAR
jgi:hypothetical protein